MDVHQYCQDRAAASGSSFYYSFVFLPPDTRRAITAFYALCRELDDVVDECHERQVAEAKLDWWRTEIGRFAAGVPEHPATRALLDTPQGRNAPAALLLEIVDGMAMDLDQPRYPDFKSLNLYCYRVAGVVGEIAAAFLTASAANTTATSAATHTNWGWLSNSPTSSATSARMRGAGGSTCRRTNWRASASPRPTC
jgi:phytoene/squalene synthetase